MKAIRILFLVIFSVVVLGALSSCDSPYEDCYKKNYKDLRKDGFSKAKAAKVAKNRCD